MKTSVLAAQLRNVQSSIVAVAAAKVGVSQA